MKFFYENKGMSVRVCYSTNLAFGAHLHNHIEMGYMLEGSTKVIVDSKECIARAGDVLIVFPNQIHQYLKIDDEKCILAIFPPDLLPELQKVFKYKVPVTPILNNADRNSRVRALFEDLIEAYKEKTNFYDTLLKGYFLALLSEMFQMMQFEDIKCTDCNTIKAVLNYCAENYTGDISLESISKAMHISKYYISHLFSQKLHMSFSEYIGMLRISDACSLLAYPDKSITDISYSVGFNSMRSFNRLFLKYTGLTPRQYRQCRNGF